MTPEEMSDWLRGQQKAIKATASEQMAARARKGASDVQKAASRVGRPVQMVTRVSKTETGAVLQIGYGRGFPGVRVAAAVAKKGNTDGGS